MLILQIFWRMYVALFVFQLFVFPLTYLLPDDPALIKWKISFYYGLFGVALLISGMFSKRGIIGLLKPKGINMPEFIWPKIDRYYSVVFILLAIVNGWFAMYIGENDWVNFKLFVPFPALVVYTIIVSLLVSKNIVENEQKSPNKHMQSDAALPPRR